MSDLSTRVRLRREELGLSQEELAQRMGYRSRSSITKLEKGVNDLPQSKVEELAQALETTPAALLGLDIPATPLCPPGEQRQRTSNQKSDIAAEITSQSWFLPLKHYIEKVQSVFCHAQ